MLTVPEREFLLKTARAVIESELRRDPSSADHEFASVDDLYRRYPNLRIPCGVFVTLKEKNPGIAENDLRGCIGTIIGREPLYEGVRRLAVESAFHDPRFLPLDRRELENIRIEISVLTPPSPVDSYHDIALGRDGILLSCSGRVAVFLPQVAAEQGWDLETTLTHLSLKAGLDADAWMDDVCTFEVFQAVVFGEDE